MLQLVRSSVLLIEKHTRRDTNAQLSFVPFCVCGVFGCSLAYHGSFLELARLLAYQRTFPGCRPVDPLAFVALVATRCQVCRAIEVHFLRLFFTLRRRRFLQGHVPRHVNVNHPWPLVIMLGMQVVQHDLRSLSGIRDLIDFSIRHLVLPWTLNRHPHKPFNRRTRNDTSLHWWAGGGNGCVLFSGGTITVVELLVGFCVDQQLVIGLGRAFWAVRSHI